MAVLCCVAATMLPAALTAPLTSGAAFAQELTPDPNAPGPPIETPTTEPSPTPAPQMSAVTYALGVAVVVLLVALIVVIRRRPRSSGR